MTVTGPQARLYMKSHRRRGVRLTGALPGDRQFRGKTARQSEMRVRDARKRSSTHILTGQSLVRVRPPGSRPLHTHYRNDG